MLRFFLHIFLLFACLFAPFLAEGQKQKPGAPPPARDTTDEYINIRFSDEFSYNLLGSDTLKQLTGHVELNQDDIYIFCDSAKILNSTRLAAKGNFILQHGDSLTIFSDSALYRADTKIADLFVNVSLVKGLQKLFTDRLTYNANTKIATYLTGATITDDSTYVTSVRGYFHADTDDIFFKDSVVVVSPDFTLRSDTLQFNASTRLVTFLAPTLIVQDTARIYTEAGFYDIGKKLAAFTKNPQYLKNDQRAWARTMRYDGNKDEITLIGDAHFEDSTTFATADRIRYNEKTEVVTLEGNAFIRDENRTITGDSVTYDARNETYATRGRSHIVDGNQVLDADKVDYDKERELGIAEGNVVWQDTTEKLTVVSGFAEHSKKKNYLKASGGKTGRPYLIKIIDGDSLYVSADTLMSIQPDTVATTRPDSLNQPPTDSISSLPQTEKPAPPKPNIPPGTPKTNKPPSDIPQKLFDIPSEKDSLLVPPKSDPDSNRDRNPKSNVPSEKDSLQTIPLPLQDSIGIDSPAAPNRQSSIVNRQSEDPRIILAFHDVRIFKSDLQALCDSLSYSNLDSMFQLFRQPIIWSDTSQFTADTVNIQLANDKIDRIFLRQNSFIVNSPDEFFFNQIKGKNSTAIFDSSELRRVRVEGNAESVYYVLDDNDAYIGVNKTICSEMLIHFGNNEVEGIRFYTEPKANLFPMEKADHEGLKMLGFSWQIERRPRSLEDLLVPRVMVPVPVLPTGKTETRDVKPDGEK